MTSGRIRIQLADDHEIVRAGFRHLLEKEHDMQVVAESATGKQACRDYERCQPDILILDISLPDISGIEVIRRILQRDSGARILVFSMHVGMVAEHAMKKGACGYICKRSGAGALISAVRHIIRGGRYLDDNANVRMPLQLIEAVKSPAGPLSRRELEICLLLTEGKSVAEIGELLHVSVKTVYTHRQHIMDKLGVTTIVELSQVAARLGIQSDG
ncbi:MAG: DNA-binding response regulator [Zetaproteobacteria bacterium CG_4_9_14_3_um_filter_49_83]|nr:MAG: DNA-binding response regulator [Zetaproteobacteria bacterium CG1_02_49_23]PIQ34526.1 MAG: DNA-binding response regulator [Zetaproteobacteria bacterium CG17_big_fil_post_rev_8_21_14_2_50_50_13]PIV31660.1 MAG: DNA-binding response regulator [Zetaproteobacteria bacterium CG02_land_8_20_14_3_00_50_9]PIY55349.1 MAG: DNA-binding response regulator [Zetaproteobacteria bacterium CG_4_10_14_0_8_um_filter_49_80]PJA34486.1 MAG: DNA-binding response regulator [Zetaproteobacteria bacterium CG_4_9_14